VEECLPRALLCEPCDAKKEDLQGALSIHCQCDAALRPEGGEGAVAGVRCVCTLPKE
jgi:hypothetical protein